MLVIKGAWYFNGNELVIPHFTGEFFIVDCDCYLSKIELKEIYDDDFVTVAMESPIEYKSTTYYPAEYNAVYTENFDLLSDLSNLAHNEEEYNF